jgi:hypothetical protein
MYVFRTCTYLRKAECTSDGNEFRGERRIARHLCCWRTRSGWLASVVHPHAPRLPRRSIQIPSFGSNFRRKIC